MDNIMSYLDKLDKISLVREPSTIDKTPIKDFSMVVDVARKFYGLDIDIQESFYAMFLDNSMQILGFCKIGQGGLASCPVDIRLICKYALSTLCTRVISVHNHPSGRLEPSREDIKFAKKLEEALKLFDIQLEDNIILTKTSSTNY